MASSQIILPYARKTSLANELGFENGKQLLLHLKGRLIT